MSAFPTAAEIAARAKGAVFDFGGVISVSPIPRWPTTLYPYCAAQGLSEQAVRDGFRDFRRLWDGDEISFDEMYRRVFARAGLAEPSGEVLANLRRLDAASWVGELRADTLALMAELRRRGLKIAILSNMSSDFHRDFFAPRCAAYRALADAEVISGPERVCKPDPRIYALVEERLGLPGRDLVFFDDFEENVRGARALGWQAEVYPPSLA